MPELSTLILTQVTKSGLNDYDQRSALGMARTWVEKREPIKWNPNQIEYPNRDQLARDLVIIMQENLAEDAEYVGALLRARKAVNAPFQRATGPERDRIAKPGEKKKAKEA